MPQQGFKLISDTLSKSLAKYSPQRLQAAVEARLETIGEGMASTAFSLVPIDTGFLQSSIYASVDGMQLELGATADYASFVEFGTRFMSAQPFLRPAFDGWINEAERAFKDVIAEALK
jgi:HK97 gp10 family phage protein